MMFLFLVVQKVGMGAGCLVIAVHMAVPKLYKLAFNLGTKLD